MTRIRLSLALATTMLVAGCSLPTLGIVPAPSGTDGDTYEISATFPDTTGLPLGARVKVNGASVGEVTAIETKDYRAIVTMDVNEDVRLTDRSRFEIRFSTPLGENFVDATPGEGGTALADGSTTPIDQGTAAPTIENAFAALSTLVNGGGLDRVGSIMREIDLGTRGRSGDIRSLTTDLQTLVSTINERSDQVYAAIDALASLSTTLQSSTGTIDAALDQFPETARVLADQNERLLALTRKLDRLSRVTDDVIERGTDVLLDDLRLLRPILSAMEDANDDLRPTLTRLVTLGKKVDSAVYGDYVRTVANIVLVFTDTVLCPSTMPDCEGR